MHVNKRRITIELGSDANIREPDRTETTQLLEQEGSGTDKQCQRNKSYLLWATPLRASLQEDARSGCLDTFRQHNSSLRYWEMESEGILEKKIKYVFYLVKRLQLQITTIHIPRKLDSTTDSLSRLCRPGDYALKDGTIQMISKTRNYMPQIDIFVTQHNKLIYNYATAELNDLWTHFHNAFSYKWSKFKLFIHPPILVLNRMLLKMKQDKAQGIAIAPIWPGESRYTILKNLSIKFLFLGQADKILEKGERMNDKDQKFPLGNVGTFLLDLSQTLGETCQ
ncbi:MAG: hypothetical protein EZS28_016584 [Streblomastix strix]|uniref:Uncharacterized protein n=1 Tax=Streblomastix strix TaxID=222440 RepID=A0A5J4W054_9EUKA|nr:MAG: hypothetical protein EZS28_016584 [Streblomastix strix]